MLPDPLVFAWPETGEVVTSLGEALVSAPLVDSATPGRTVRAWSGDGLNGTLTISHSETKENKPYGTKRVNIRNEATKVDDAGVTVTIAVQTTLIFRKSGFSETDLSKITEMLLPCILCGYSTESARDLSSGRALRTRLLLGEG